MDKLETLERLSHEFGVPEYVRGGGGNTSAKDENTLWVKPSGTTLSTIKAGDFVVLDRAKLAELDDLDPGIDEAERQEKVQQIMASAKKDPRAGRPSVEAPLHNLLAGDFIVHTHPAVVNGMLCAKEGAKACSELFEDALWVDYIDPGFTLYRHLRNKISGYQADYGRQPEMIFLKNHGVFVSAGNAQRIRDIYEVMFDKLRARYDEASVELELPMAALPDERSLTKMKEQIISAYPEEPVNVAVSGVFEPADGPLTPDHIVYAGSFPLKGEPTKQAINEHREEFATLPRVIKFDGAVFAVGKSRKKAELALELAQDAALVRQLTKAFGGVEYMDERARRFIENWEVEAYRSKQV